jgi:bifunctional ADP-heptose synthase (sugar kinase/adenylyltransferase)
MLDSATIEKILTSIPQKTIGLVGDLFLDRYLDIDSGLNEPSVETGLTAYQVVNVRNYPGALGTVLNNLAALGVGRIEPVSVIGNDGEGFELVQALKKLPAVQRDGLLHHPEVRTPTYTKPMLTTGNVSQELNRLDIKNRRPMPSEAIEHVVKCIRERWSRWDAVLILDQVSENNCGVVADAVRELVDALTAENPAKFVLADSRERIGLFEKVFVKPNAVESERLPHRAGQGRFITRGEAGLELWEPAATTGKAIHAYPVNGPIDICGAGDSCSAGIACAMMSGCTLEQAASFGNLIASITIQQIGVTGTASPKQVRERWRELQH